MWVRVSEVRDIWRCFDNFFRYNEQICPFPSRNHTFKNAVIVNKSSSRVQKRSRGIVAIWRHKGLRKPECKTGQQSSSRCVKACSSTLYVSMSQTILSFYSTQHYMYSMWNLAFNLRSFVIVQTLGVVFTRNSERFQDRSLNPLKNKKREIIHSIHFFISLFLWAYHFSLGKDRNGLHLN